MVTATLTLMFLRCVVVVASQNSVTPASATMASAIWGYSNRTMSGFGSLAAGIWRYSGGALWRFGHGSGSVKGTQSTTTDDALIREPQVPLKQFVDEPAIQNSLDADLADFEGHIQDSVGIVNALYLRHQYIHSRIGLMSLNWDTLTPADVTKGLAEIDTALGDESDVSARESVFGRIAWLRDRWKWSVLDDVYSQTQAMKAAVKQSTQGRQEIEAVVAYSTILDRLIGDRTHRNGQETVFGKLNSTKDIADALKRATKK